MHIEFEVGVWQFGLTFYIVCMMHTYAKHAYSYFFGGLG